MTGRAAILPRAVPDSSSYKPEWMRTAAPPLTAKKTMMEKEEAAEEAVEAVEAAEAEAEAEEAEGGVVLVHLGHHRILIPQRS